MKKNLFLMMMCLLPPGVLQAQTLRDAVAVVRPNYTAGTVKFLTDFSASLRRDGYKAAADVLAAYAKGGYGTGILWKNPADSRYYIVTNRHVVAQAKDVTIEFMPADAPVVNYPACPIVAVDESADMALIALPADAVFAAALDFSTVAPTDGDEVYTAGFPGLGSDPSWQLGKGIVSNSSARLKDWTVQQAAKIVQHTAQVDAGSSGGPLLVKDSSPLGYSVVGINTWQAAGRENANFSIAAATMRKFLDTNHHRLPELTGMAQGFAMAIKSGYRSVYPYISDDYIDHISVNDFYELLGALSDTVRNEVGSCFGNGMPIDGVRIGLAEALSHRFRKNTMHLEHIDSTSAGATRVVFSYGGTHIESHWTARNGAWGMSDFSALHMRDMAKSGVATTYGYRNAVLLGLGFPANDLTGLHFSLGYEYTLGTFLLFGFDLSRGSFDNPYTDSELIKGTWHEKDTVRTLGAFGVGAHVGAQFPVKLGGIYVIPNAKIYYGIDFMDDRLSEDPGFEICRGYSFGLNGARKLRRNTYLIAGLQYRTVSFFDDVYPRAKPRLLELVLGITF